MTTLLTDKIIFNNLSNSGIQTSGYYITNYLSNHIHNSANYSQLSNITPSDNESGDQYGYAITASADGSYVAVSSLTDDDSGTNAGAVYVYSKNIEGYTQMQKIISDPTLSPNGFGEVIKLSPNGKYLAISQYDTSQASDYKSYVLIYQLNSSNNNNTYNLIQTLTEQTNSAIANFIDYGCSISFSFNGNRLAIGASGELNSTTGKVYMYIKGNSGYVLEQEIQSSDIAVNDLFGKSLDMNYEANKIIIGAPKEDTAAADAGTVYYFTRNGTTWTQQQKINASDGGSNDQFGIVVKMSANSLYIVVSSLYDDDNGDDAGAVYVYNLNGATNQWGSESKLISSDGEANDLLGNSIDINVLGNIIVIGCSLEDSSGSSSGAVYIFNRRYDNSGLGTSINSWTQGVKLIPDDLAANDEFGQSVVVTNSNILATSSPGQHFYTFQPELHNTTILQSEQTDSTTNTTITVNPVTSVLHKTGNTSNAGYTITLPTNHIVGRLLTIIVDNEDTTGISFSPSVTGFSNPTNIGANGTVTLYYSQSNTWYRIM